MQILELVNWNAPQIDVTDHGNLRWDLSVMHWMVKNGRQIDWDFLRNINLKHSNKRAVLRSDFAYVCDMVVSQRVKDYIDSLKLPKIDFYPLRIFSKQFYTIIVRNRIDCLDRKQSVINYSTSNPNRFVSISKYRFLKNKIGKNQMFRLRGDKRHIIFVTDVFAEGFDAQKFKGYRFIDIENPPKHYYVA